MEDKTSSSETVEDIEDKTYSSEVEDKTISSETAEDITKRFEEENNSLRYDI